MTLEAAVARCADCGADVPPGVLACPGCRRLTHRDELKRLVAEAEARQAAGDAGAALAAWRQALELLPADSRQHQQLAERAARLSQSIAASPSSPSQAQPPPPAWAKKLGPFGVVVVFLWKLKFLVLALLSKGKLLLLGLTKITTLLSMLLSFGAYWALYGWRFALGLVASIYVHEMGHVSAMRRFGMPATAPMFIPGVGAFVRLKSHPTTRVEDARIGLAGPLWGLAATAVATGLRILTGSPVWGAIAHAGAWINLFNLLPVWQLDGARGFSALGRAARALVAGAFALVWLETGDGLCALIGIVAAMRALGRDAAQPSDRATLIELLLLVGALGLFLAYTAG